MTIKFANNVSTSIPAGISASQVSFSVNSTSGFPTLTTGDYFYATLFNQTGSIEIVKVTDVAGIVVTCVRGQDGTVPLAWIGSTQFEVRVTAQVLRELGAGGFILEHKNVVTEDIIIGNGNNGVSGGPMEVSSGVTVTVPVGSTWIIV